MDGSSCVSTDVDAPPSGGVTLASSQALVVVTGAGTVTTEALGANTDNDLPGEMCTLDERLCSVVVFGFLLLLLDLFLTDCFLRAMAGEFG
jgi:hypothetical protein